MSPGFWAGWQAYLGRPHEFGAWLSERGTNGARTRVEQGLPPFGAMPGATTSAAPKTGHKNNKLSSSGHKK